MDQMLLCVTSAFSAPLRFMWSPFSFTAENAEVAQSLIRGLLEGDSRSLCPPAAAEPRTPESHSKPRGLIRLDGDCLNIRRVNCRDSAVLGLPRELAFGARF